MPPLENAVKVCRSFHCARRAVKWNTCYCRYYRLRASLLRLSTTSACLNYFAYWEGKKWNNIPIFVSLKIAYNPSAKPWNHETLDEKLSKFTWPTLSCNLFRMMYWSCRRPIFIWEASQAFHLSAVMILMSLTHQTRVILIHPTCSLETVANMYGSMVEEVVIKSMIAKTQCC